nr:hypothetical protein Itr_chr05CG11380 [Ipomoea trifida]
MKPVGLSEAFRFQATRSNHGIELILLIKVNFILLLVDSTSKYDNPTCRMKVSGRRSRSVVRTESSRSDACVCMKAVDGSQITFAVDDRKIEHPCLSNLYFLRKQ